MARGRSAKSDPQRAAQEHRALLGLLAQWTNTVYRDGLLRRRQCSNINEDGTDRRALCCGDNARGSRGTQLYPFARYYPSRSQGSQLIGDPHWPSHVVRLWRSCVICPGQCSWKALDIYRHAVLDGARSDFRGQNLRLQSRYMESGHHGV